MTRRPTSQDEDEAQLLEAAGVAATLSRNDPDYVADLEELRRDVNEVANAVAGVHLVEGKGGARIEVALQRPRHRPEASRAALGLGRLLEAPVTRTVEPAAGDSGVGSQGQPARHTHYKDDRR